MPAETLDFRRRCGVFVFIFIYFMFKRVKSKQRKPGLRFKTWTDGVLFGMTLSFLTWGVLLLRQCGDVELNPGPPSPPPPPAHTSGSSRTLRQQTLTTRQSSSSPSGSRPDSASSATRAGKEPSIADVLARLDTLESVDRKVDQLVGDLKDLRDGCLALQSDVKNLRDECEQLREDNNELRGKNTQLEKRVEALERKTDDLECRSKRNNILIHGFHRPEGETAQDLEDGVRDFFTDRLELGDIPFDRLHRLNSKPDSPVIGCCSSFRDKLEVMKAKRKLRGTKVYIGEDFSLRVRDIRRRLTPHLKTAREQNKRVRMVFDHLIIEGKKFTVDSGDNLVEVV